MEAAPACQVSSLDAALRYDTLFVPSQPALFGQEKRSPHQTVNEISLRGTRENEFRDLHPVGRSSQVCRQGIDGLIEQASQNEKVFRVISAAVPGHVRGASAAVMIACSCLAELAELQLRRDHFICECVEQSDRVKRVTILAYESGEDGQLQVDPILKILYAGIGGGKFHDVLLVVK